MTMPDPLANPIKPEDDTQASIPAPEAPSVPPASAPAGAEAPPPPGTPTHGPATAAPGSTTYGTAYDAAGAQSFPGPEQSAANQAPFGGAPGAQPSPEQPAYGSAGYSDPAYGQPAYGQPAYGQQAYATPPKQWVLALVLAFFLGGFGVHNFYLGYTTRGIIQLLLTITLVGAPISAIWALIEFIMIIMRSGSYGYDASGQPLV